MRVTINGEAMDVDARTLRELVDPLPHGSAVAVNGEVVPRAELAQRDVHDGDVIEVVTAVAGG